MTRREALPLLSSLLLPRTSASEVNRERLPGVLRLEARARDENSRPIRHDLIWPVASTAIIICDMWDNHYCQSSARRLAMMVPRMNEVLKAARRAGVMIIHAPSGTMDVYKNTPFRRRMTDAKPATPPEPIGKWCYLDRKREAGLPIDDVTEPCDDAVVGERVRRYNRQHEGIEIAAYDGISDSGQEIYNFCEKEGIGNIALMGVHANMCVLGRSFGIRQMTRIGRQVVLVRDLTDAMYDPRQRPYVSHERGTELVVEHIERYWCPSVKADDLMLRHSQSS